MNVNKIREDFPILSEEINGHKLIYFDNASTTQKPMQVIEAISDYYKHKNSNVHRGLHSLSVDASVLYEKAHENTEKFINASPGEVFFTSGTTSSINLLAPSLTKNLKPGSKILATTLEHHSNYLPWDAVCNSRKLLFETVSLDGFNLDMEDFQEKVKGASVVAFTHASNVLGTVTDAKEIIKIAHENGALTVVDGAQSVPHIPTDVKKLDADFLAFSGHKMIGPTGIGVTYGKEELLKTLDPTFYGGGMVKEVAKKIEFANPPEKFEAGTPNISGAVGLSAAVDYLRRIGMKDIEQHEHELLSVMRKSLATEKIKLYNSDSGLAIVSFTIDGLESHDISVILDENGIATRSGHHCCQPLMAHFGVNGTTRASLYLYNTKEEVKRFSEVVHSMITML